ncbi:hypothetical protein QBC46DRAFT_453217 [Diplogelasinospora grovesii]|uniref:Uncharacterized protein n=1 Tax=Diplogelasinospora grovesii TaxID=303347 RepID=A0AAN6N1L3_9PEZI|nr:hypothetical protein QBC46DRAFT_453217 [Diplogelasinospora grovesii]
MLLPNAITYFVLPISAVWARDIVLQRDELNGTVSSRRCNHLSYNVCCSGTTSFLLWDRAVFIDVRAGDKLVTFLQNGVSGGCEGSLGTELLSLTNQAQVVLQSAILRQLSGARFEHPEECSGRNRDL